MTIAELRATLAIKPRNTPRRHLESMLQQSCVRWFRLVYPEYALRLFAIPNGGQRGKAEAARLKCEGVLAGVPDLFLAVPNQDHNAHGLFIEMKVGANKASEKQVRVLKDFGKAGYHTALVYSFDQFRNDISTYIGY